MNQKLFVKGYVFIVLSAVIYGLMPLMAKFIYLEGITPMSLALLRNLLSFPFLFGLAISTKGSARIPLRALPSIGFIATMGFFTTMLLYTAYEYIPSGTATVFHFVYPAVVVIGEILLFKIRIGRGQIAGVILCVMGIVLFYNPQSKINLQGSIFALFSGITYASYVMGLSGFKYKEISSFTVCFYVALISSVALLVICLCTSQLTLPISATGWLLSLIFALSLNVGSLVLFQKGTFLIGGSRASVLSTLEPVTSVLAGVVIFREKTSGFAIVGTVLVICASLLIALMEPKELQ